MTRTNPSAICVSNTRRTRRLQNLCRGKHDRRQVPFFGGRGRRFTISMAEMGFFEVAATGAVDRQAIAAAVRVSCAPTHSGAGDPYSSRVNFALHGKSGAGTRTMILFYKIKRILSISQTHTILRSYQNGSPSSEGSCS